jgi:hypothetical protein
LFFTFFDDFVSAEGAVALREAVGLPAFRDGVQDGGHVGLRALGELVVVVAVAAGGRGEHDVVADLAAGPALGWVIVLKVDGIPLLVSITTYSLCATFEYLKPYHFGIKWTLYQIGTTEQGYLFAAFPVPNHFIVLI